MYYVKGYLGYNISVKRKMPNKGTKPPLQQRSKGSKNNRVEIPPKRKPQKIVWGTVSVVATLLAFLVLWPRVTATIANPPIDPQNVLSASFSISNTGNIPLNHVNISVIVSYLSIAPKNHVIVQMAGPDMGTGKQGLDFVNPSWQNHQIDTNESVTISPESQVDVKVSEADIVIRTSYEPWFIPVRLEKRFRFVARKDGSGNIYWRAWPLNETAPPN
jgi:hypothetical protein